MRLKSLFFYAFSTFILFFCHPIFSQNDTLQSTSAIETEQTSIENSSQLISISTKNTDEEIKSRIQKILITVGRYENLVITVQAGLIFIEGEAIEQRFIDLASDISKNIEGVVAVINNLTLKKKEYLTTEPIKNELIRIWYKSLEILPLLLIGIIIFSIAFLLSSPISRLLTKPIDLLTESELIKIVIKKLVSIFIVLIGLYFFLRLAGLTQFAVAIISGTGMMGLILGFAFRDIAENFMSSLLLSVQRPFRLGDVIAVQAHKGIVKKVTARGTTLVDFDGNHIQIPNSTIYKNIIHNFTANPKLRGSFSIGIGYDADIMQAQAALSQLMRNHDAVLEEPETQVLIENLGSSTINLIVYFWIDSHRYEVKKVASNIMRLTIARFLAMGVSMPDDAREIIFPDGIPVSIEHDKTNKKKLKPPIKGVNIESSTMDEIDDLSSDTNDIRKQAESARDPESGNNIL